MVLLIAVRGRQEDFAGIRLARKVQALGSARDLNSKGKRQSEHLHICVHLRAQSVESRSTKVGNWPWAAGQTALDSRPFPKDNVQPGSEAPSSLLPQPSLRGAGEWEVTLANLLCYQPLALGVRLPVWQLLVSPG